MRIAFGNVRRSYRRFSGNEDVEDDQALLFRLIGDHAPDRA
jgi:hypothetical protein